MRAGCLIISLLFFASISAQKKKEPKQTRILFVFDASRSMVSKFQNATRMDGAKDLFFKFIDTLARDRTYQFALRMYGHTVKYPPGSCKDSRLLVPFSANNLALIKQRVKEARPTGITPIEHSLTEAANDFKDPGANNIVILITDGIEECGGDPCKARQKLIEKGIVFKPFIIGIGLTPEQIKTFECVGSFYDAADPEVYSTISNIIQQQKLNRTTLQVNLLDKSSQPVETNVNITLSDAERDQYRYNLIHTLNSEGRPDTLVVDEHPTYSVTAHTIPPVTSGEKKLTPGKHNVIALDAPQGYLHIKRNSGAYNFNEKVKCVIRRSGDMQTLNVQNLNTTEKYIVGQYDLEILTLPRISIWKTAIDQSKTFTVEIPNAGVVQIRCMEAGDGTILINRNGKLEWVCNLSPQTMQTYYLQPGNYLGIWRARSLRGSIYTVERKFRVTSDTQTIVEFYR